MNLDSVRSTWTPRLLSLMRIILGFTFAAHGSQKLLAYPDTGGKPAFPLLSFFGFAGTLELVGGLMLLFGLFTRPVAFILSGMMAVAYFTAHAPGGFWPVVNHGELAVVYCFVFLYLSAAGGGPLSLDKVLRKVD